MERALRDLRLAARSWRRSPGLAAAAVVTLALALGANTTLFSLVNAVLLRPLPGIAHADRLVNVHRRTADGTTFLGVSHPDYRDLRERTRALDGLAAFNGRGVSLGDGTGAPELVGIQIVSGNYFDVLGVRPLRGRLLSDADDGAPGASPVAVISHALWQRRFGSDPAVVGRSVRLNGFPFTVVGVGPEGFAGPLHRLPVRGLGAALHGGPGGAGRRPRLARQRLAGAGRPSRPGPHARAGPGRPRRRDGLPRPRAPGTARGRDRGRARG